MKDKDNFLMKKEWGLTLFDPDCPVDDETAGKMLKYLYASILGIDYEPDLEKGDRREVNKWLRVIEANEEAYRETCRKNAENRKGKKAHVDDRERPLTTVDDRSPKTPDSDLLITDLLNTEELNTGFESDSDSDSEIPPYNPPKGKRKRFVKPTVEEVSEYCTERQNDIDPEEFVDFYESKGWKVGREPMKDWKACVRTWEKSHRHRPREKPKFNTDNYLMSIAMGGTA